MIRYYKNEEYDDIDLDDIDLESELEEMIEMLIRLKVQKELLRRLEEMR